MQWRNWSWGPAGLGCNQRQMATVAPAVLSSPVRRANGPPSVPSAFPTLQAQPCSQGQQACGIHFPGLLSPLLPSESSLGLQGGPSTSDAPLPLNPHPPRLLQQENEELRRRLASATRRTEALERELEIGQDCLELELGQSREELDKFKDKFRRCGTGGWDTHTCISPFTGGC